MRILVVEDENAIREGIIAYLQNQGYSCWGAADGIQALNLFKQQVFELILLDIMLPKLNGLEVLQHIRNSSNVPVIVLTAFSDEEYKISAFSKMADGYLEKPFSLALLGARVSAVKDRYYANSNIFTYQDCEVDFAGYTARYKGVSVAINPKELEVLRFLLANTNKVLTRGQILDNVWKNQDEAPYDRVIDVYIKELRRKLGLDCIVTVRNVGYMLKLED